MHDGVELLAVLLDPVQRLLRAHDVRRVEARDVLPFVAMAEDIADRDTATVLFKLGRNVGADEAGAAGDKDHWPGFPAGVAMRWTMLVVL